MNKTKFAASLLLILVVGFLIAVSTPNTVEAASHSQYTVKSGDSLWKISKKYGIALSDLRKANNKYDDMIRVGQKLKIPTNVGAKSTVTTATKKVAAKSKVTAEERHLLARLVHAEARGESHAGKVAVAQVVLNRVKHSQFPNTIRGVIYQRSQFSVVSNGSINKTASSTSYKATDEAIAKGSNASGVVFFYNPRTCTNKWNFTRTTVFKIGNHVFTR